MEDKAIKTGDLFIVERLHSSCGHDGNYDDCVFVCTAVEGEATIGQFTYTRDPWKKGESAAFRVGRARLLKVSQEYVDVATAAFAEPEEPATVNGHEHPQQRTGRVSDRPCRPHQVADAGVARRPHQVGQRADRRRQRGRDAPPHHSHPGFDRLAADLGLTLVDDTDGHRPTTYYSHEAEEGMQDQCETDR